MQSRCVQSGCAADIFGRDASQAGSFCTDAKLDERRCCRVGFLLAGHQSNIRLRLCRKHQTTAASVAASSAMAYRSTAHRFSVVSNDSLAQLSTNKVFPTQISAPSALRGSIIAAFTPKQGDVPNFLS
mmetsp:Transcript_21955/g.51551  ORF Transcript_21955/g.51551 Transcript_21955/m.51551 type:complete len:128 (+) Transcript_21955:128-511(+)